MNSFQDLNNYGSNLVTFTDNSAYYLEWGPFAGNANIQANTTVATSLLNRQTINVFTGSIKPLAVIVTSPNDSEGIPIANVVYSGPNANINLVKNNLQQWVFGNIWTVADYNEAFANGTVYIEGLRQNDFTYSTQVIDQQGNSRIWYTTVDVVPFGFSRPSSVVYAEDSNAQVTGMAITDISNQDYIITMSLTPTVAGNIKWDYTGTTGNTLTATGNRNVVNQYLQGNITFIPSDDYVSPANITANVFNSTTSNVVGLANIQLVCGATHADYSVPSSLAWGLGANVPIGTTTNGDIRITDLAQNRSYSSTVSFTPSSIGNLYNGATNLGNSVTYTGNITVVNANLANIVLVCATSGNANGNLRYQQTQTTANIVQADVTIPIPYQIKAIHIASGVEKPVGNALNTDGSQPSSTTHDFWAYQKVGSSYSVASDLSVISSTSIYKYPPFGIFLRNASPMAANAPTGFEGRFESRSPGVGYGAGTAAYLGFWFALSSGFNSDCNLAWIETGYSYPDAYTGHFNFSIYNNQLYWIVATGQRVWNNPSDVIWSPNTINLGPINYGTWEHFALQVNSGTIGYRSGTRVVSAWRNGTPITQFYNADGVGNPRILQTGSTWDGRNNIGTINGFRFGIKASYGSQFSFAIDDVVVRSDNPYTNLQSFTPAPITWGGNVTQMVTGV